MEGAPTDGSRPDAKDAAAAAGTGGHTAGASGSTAGEGGAMAGDTAGAGGNPGAGGATAGAGGATAGAGGNTGAGGATAGAGGAGGTHSDGGAGMSGLPDAAVAPDAGCSSSQHLCAASGTCQLNDSVVACGATCAVCPAPTGGTASCASNACDFSCGALKMCAAAKLCIPATGCCDQTDCPAQNGKTGSCDTGAHTCSYACPANTKTCGNGCIPAGGCCVDADCPGVCQQCDASHVCKAALSQPDPNARCSGTCDAAGACKSKQGQTCTTATANGCIAGTPCSDGYCCNQACLGACMACDLTGLQGTCTTVASGAPHGTRSCAAPTGGTASCSAGSCASSCGANKMCQPANICISPTSCCQASECPGVEGKMAACDATAHTCGYTCLATTKDCNGICIPTASACTTLLALVSVADGEQLIHFGATTPGAPSSSKLISGVPTGVRLISMSYRPSTGVLYALGGDSHLYTVDTTAAAATAVGTPISPTLDLTPSQYMAMAFVPGTDVIRIWNATGQNLRVGPTGGTATVDTNLPPGFGTGIAPRTIAFTTGTVTLYALDALNDTLAKALDANAGTIVQVGPLGINMEAAGLAIVPGTTTAFAVTELDSQNRDPRLYSVNLATGALTSVGPFSAPPGLVRALVVAP